jgi:polar amino acid transport system substrate-binding protein
MKKFISMTLAAVAAFTTLSMAACQNGQTKYVATAISGIEVEEYGFAVGKNSTNKTAILSAMNEVISSSDLSSIVAYYTAVAEEKTPSVTLDFANLDDNTGGTLNVYTCSGFEPYEFVVSDEVVGVDIYLMELVAEKLNMKLSVTDMDFDGICGKVASEDNAVGAAGITINDERKQTIDFSNPYYNSVQYIISKDSEAFSSLESLAGKKIGVQKGTTGALLVEDAIANGVLKDTGAEMIEYDTGAVAYVAMKQSKIDYVVIDELPALALVKGN